MPTSHFITQNTKKMRTQGQELMKLTIFSASSRTFLSEIGFWFFFPISSFFYCEYVVMKNIMATVGATAC